MNFLFATCRKTKETRRPRKTVAMELCCVVQKYAWGKVGKSSLVAQLSQGNSAAPVVEVDPYAELWMGTHPSGPSLIKTSNEPLLNHLLNNVDSLGDAEKKSFGTDLPFLFKALSVAKALSIQAHPNKKHAEELFATRPDLYKDPNHKPEMVTAWLGPFEALCGFRPIADIKFFIQEIDELAAVVGKAACEALVKAESDSGEMQALRECFSALMNSSEESIASALQQFEKRIPSLSAEKKESLQCDLFTRIAADFPGDVGCWSVYFMNYVVLQEGESMFLGPNVPHAYIFGDCLECMACSDNVVRAGLTPKFKDIDTLCSMLDYQPGPVDRFRMQWTAVDAFCQECFPPVPDFAMARLRLPASATVDQAYRLPSRSNASVLLILQGQASSAETAGDLNFGQVLFLKAGQQLTLKVKGGQDLIVYQAFANV
ncbi:mannose-6-phosphate isomerase-like isoform X2 [Daphnia pulicaria]|uniref:mannose-6-phosphate isomerase-like isoform X2 n=1 Tax=Daphnia pulicaria TaxID=35523 RepID=UPI001EEB3AE3|nr:mannose-6-phosphate isomerase-like isoform X2 [Daphnia pulicaria]